MAASSDNKLAYVELCPSSVVTHCVSCRLTAAAQSCLVIARLTAIEVYTLSVTAGSNAAGASGKGRSAPLEGVCGAQLELIARSELFGVVESLRSVRLPGAAHDTLLVAFADAKLALLEYDPAARVLRTRAAHSFDALALSAGCVESAALPPRLTVQPEGSCAALLAHNAMLVMVALRGAAVRSGTHVATAAEVLAATKAANAVIGTGLVEAGHRGGGGGASGGNGGGGGGGGGGNGASGATAGGGGVVAGAGGWWAVPLAAVSAQNTRDLCFLHGHAGPTLALLCEPQQTWAGRLTTKANTCCLIVLAVDMAAKKYSQIWRADGLPYDCSSLLPLPDPLGGVLVLSDNALLWVNHSARFGLGLNGDARTTATSLRAAPPGTWCT